ncbi:MAG: antitoxin VbhA family protein [Candidatus Paceibacterota bacterium]
MVVQGGIFLVDIKKVESSVKATMAIEGLKPSKQGENITNLYLRGKIDSKTAIKQIKKYWGIK